MSDIDTLVELGFPREKVVVALRATENQGIEAAADWLLAHMSEDPVETESPKPIDATQETPAATGVLPDLLPNPDPTDESQNDQAEEVEEEKPTAMRCDVCGRCFADAASVEKHASRTAHLEFSEITSEEAESEKEPPAKQLTEEERQQRLKRAEELIRLRREEKSEKEKKEKLEKEKQRRKTGQEMLSMKQKFQEEELKRSAEERRREKIEAKLERQRILEQIERDKADRREKFSNVQQPQPPSVPAPCAAAPASLPTQPKIEYTECRLQIRLTNGVSLKETFQPNEQLAAVRLYVQLNRTDGDGPFTLMSAFPKQVYTDEDMEKSLASLGLVPSAVLMVKRQ